MIVNIDASKRSLITRDNYLTSSAPTTASDGSFLTFAYKYVWILNDSSIYVDGLAIPWENY